MYPFAIPAIQALSELPFTAPVTFFVGENGSGKSTLLEAIAVAAGFNAEGGTKNFNFSTVNAHSKLHEHLTLVRNTARERDGFFLRAESFFNVATELERLHTIDVKAYDAYGGKSLHVRSHGESLLAMMRHRLGGRSLFLFDEPEIALSPLRQLSAMALMRKLELRGCQFIIATHSPIIMAYPGATILQFGDHALRRSRMRRRSTSPSPAISSPTATGCSMCCSTALTIPTTVIERDP
ncbi:MAG: AAA family ATPase [Dehalococcoidia bacterium]